MKAKIKIFVTLLIILLTLPFPAKGEGEAKLLLDEIGIEKIISATIIYCPNGFSDKTDSKFSFVTDQKELGKLQNLLSRLPAKGSGYKDWPKNIPYWEIYIKGENGKIVDLNIYGTSLQSPLDKTFSAGSLDDPKNEKLMGLLKELLD